MVKKIHVLTTCWRRHMLLPETSQCFFASVLYQKPSKYHRVRQICVWRLWSAGTKTTNWVSEARAWNFQQQKIKDVETCESMMMTMMMIFLCLINGCVGDRDEVRNFRRVKRVFPSAICIMWSITQWWSFRFAFVEFFAFSDVKRRSSVKFLQIWLHNRSRMRFEIKIAWK